jgi:hypothetical protein
MLTHNQIRLTVKLLEKISEKNRSIEIGRNVERAKAALEEHGKAEAENKTEEAEKLAEEISNLAQNVYLLDSTSPYRSRLDKIFGMIALSVACCGILGFIIAYTYSSATRPLTTIDSVRPILVIASIISTIIFGGTLIVAALFSAEGTFDERFRRAREIFLVFSGIFGTVFGFYFGAGESKQQLIFDATRDGNTVTVYASGGTSPYKITATCDPKNNDAKVQEVKDGFVIFTFTESECKDSIVVSAIDSKGLQSSSKTLAALPEISGDYSNMTEKPDKNHPQQQPQDAPAPPEKTNP